MLGYIYTEVPTASTISPRPGFLAADHASRIFNRSGCEIALQGACRCFDINADKLCLIAVPCPGPLTVLVGGSEYRDTAKRI